MIPPVATFRVPSPVPSALYTHFSMIPADTISLRLHASLTHFNDRRNPTYTSS